MLVCPPAVLTVSGQGQLLRSWDLSSGQLKYEASTSLPPATPVEGVHSISYPLSQTWRPAGVLATLAGKTGGWLEGGGATSNNFDKILEKKV